MLPKILGEFAEVLGKGVSSSLFRWILQQGQTGSGHRTTERVGGITMAVEESVFERTVKRPEDFLGHERCRQREISAG